MFRDLFANVATEGVKSESSMSIYPYAFIANVANKSADVTKDNWIYFYGEIFQAYKKDPIHSNDFRAWHAELVVKNANNFQEMKSICGRLKVECLRPSGQNENITCLQTYSIQLSDWFYIILYSADITSWALYRTKQRHSVL